MNNQNQNQSGSTGNTGSSTLGVNKDNAFSDVNPKTGQKWQPTDEGYQDYVTNRQNQTSSGSSTTGTGTDTNTQGAGQDSQSTDTDQNQISTNS